MPETVPKEIDLKKAELKDLATNIAAVKNDLKVKTVSKNYAILTISKYALIISGTFLVGVLIIYGLSMFWNVDKSIRTDVLNLTKIAIINFMLPIITGLTGYLAGATQKENEE